MGCRSCGSKRKSRPSGIPIFDADGNVVIENYQPSKRRNKPKRIRLPAKPNTSIDKYPNLETIGFNGTRINVSDYDKENKCVYIIGYMEGCGSCNYMKRLLSKIMNTHIKNHIKVYVLEKQITEPIGFVFTGNPTILLVDKGKIVFQTGGVYNKIGNKIVEYLVQ